MLPMKGFNPSSKFLPLIINHGSFKGLANIVSGAAKGFKNSQKLSNFILSAVVVDKDLVTVTTSLMTWKLHSVSEMSYSER